MPEHKGIERQTGEEAAREISAPNIPILPILDKKEAVSEFKTQMAEEVYLLRS